MMHLVAGRKQVRFSEEGDRMADVEGSFPDAGIVSTMNDDYQLTITAILRHGATVHARSECVSWLGGSAGRASFGEVAANAHRLAVKIVPAVINDAVRTLLKYHLRMSPFSRIVR